MYPVILVIDANELRAQQVARLLTLTDYRAVLAPNAYVAFQRVLHEGFVPQVIVLGQSDITHQPLFARLYHHLGYPQKQVPLVLLRHLQVDAVPLYADLSGRATHKVSRSSLEVLESIWSVAPNLRKNFVVSTRSMVLEKLPELGFQPQSTKKRHGRNYHFRLSLKTAYQLIGERLWYGLMTDVGLAQYREHANWPANDTQLAIPFEQYSCLHQAVAFSNPSDIPQVLTQWSGTTTTAFLNDKLPSNPLTALFIRMLHLLPKGLLMENLLKSGGGDINTIYDEKMFAWIPRSDGGYWVVFQSNPYAYGRNASVMPGCHVWVVVWEMMFKIMKVEDIWEAREVECSTQSLTGHCLFEVRRR